VEDEGDDAGQLELAEVSDQGLHSSVDPDDDKAGTQSG
jgi:hypothetical protein